MEVDIVVSPIRCTSMPHEGGGENKSQSDIGEQGLLEIQFNTKTLMWISRY